MASFRLLYLSPLVLVSSLVLAADKQARGVLVALDKATLSSELAARVTTLPKKMGESFKKGDTLIGLDCRLFEAQLEKVAAEDKVAQVRLDNVKQLNQLRSVGTLDVAIAEAEQQKTKAEHKIARLNVDRCQIKAPFDGYIEQLEIHNHETVQPQQALLSIVSRDRLEADIIVPAEWMKWLAVNKKLSLQVDETEQRLDAILTYIGPSVDPTSQTLQIRARINKVPDKVLPGMSVVAEF